MFDNCYAQAALNSSNGDVICQDDYDPHVIASECCAVATVKQRNLFYYQKIKPINLFQKQLFSEFVQKKRFEGF